MNLQYFEEKNSHADCPNCRNPSLVLLSSPIKSKNGDLLTCKSFKLAIADDLKKELFTV